MNQWKSKSVSSENKEALYCTSLVGRISGSDESGVLVTFDGREPTRARLFAVGVELCELMRLEGVGREVLISCEEGDPMRPIITGVSCSVLDELVVQPEQPVKLDPVVKPSEVRVDGQRIVFEGDHEIELKCGKSSITLKKNGRIVIKGSELLSRASGTNRIKGGSVGIN